MRNPFRTAIVVAGLVGGCGVVSAVGASDRSTAADILDAAQKPVVLDAELKAQLAEVPVQCRKDLGGDPNSVPCQWATCLQFGQSSAQRPECSDISDLLVETMKAQHAPRSSQ